MKAMEAPEKLYLRKRNKLPLEVVRDEWYETDPQSPYGSVEYTRTDAFIKKACEWLKFNLQDYADEDSCRNSVPFDKDVFEAFRKAMKEDL